MPVLPICAAGQNPMALLRHYCAIAAMIGTPVAVATVPCDISQTGLGLDVDPRRDVNFKAAVVTSLDAPTQVCRAVRMVGARHLGRKLVGARCSA